ncbi:MAG: rhodanese-related sulfurtransferase [Pyrinomonadaceae bacterium]
MSNTAQVVNFYEFKPLGGPSRLLRLKDELRSALVGHGVYGTIILAEEGYNGSLCGPPERVENLLRTAASILGSEIKPRTTFCDVSPFRKQEVKIKPEIVTLRLPVDLSLGRGTHVEPNEWNAIISDPEVIVLDARNDYEFRSGTFRNAVNPETAKFSELPEFVAENLDPAKHTKVAMFCTGGIRCEKLAPFMKARGFEQVFQLNGGILRYLEEVPDEEKLWDGECFVFDERITLNEKLAKGTGNDLSLRHPGKSEVRE